MNPDSLCIDPASNGSSQSNQGQAAASYLRHPKVSASHRQRIGCVYVRQSTPMQLLEHRESTARQYAMRERVAGLGWHPSAINVIDDDLGLSGSGSANRQGFRRLLKLITQGEVGIVAGLEMSRLARNSKDWSELFEVCAIFDTLIADEDGIFDPQDPNDRLVLGLKGIISELELHTMKVRMQRGKLNKAQRGEMFVDVPVGYMLDEQRMPQLDPDDSARRVIALFFDLFPKFGSANAVLKHLHRHDIRFPFRRRKQNQDGKITWRLPSASTLTEMLKHPLYAGAYGYGRRKNYRKKGAKNDSSKLLPPEQWQVLLHDRHPAYITWDQFLSNQTLLEVNCQKSGFTGPTREGLALLTGLVRCATCGYRMSLNYPQSGAAYYQCNSHASRPSQTPCRNSIRCDILDDSVVVKLMEVLKPAGAELSLQVIEDESKRRKQLEQLYLDRESQARYQVDLAQRRYENVDPANRLVASRLESSWNDSLTALREAETELNQLRDQCPVTLTNQERDDLLAAASGIADLWSNLASVKDRKDIARLMISKVEMSVRGVSQHVDVRLVWSGGFESCHQVTRTVGNMEQWDGYDETIDQILAMTLAGKDAHEIADKLSNSGLRSPRLGKPFTANMIRVLLRKDKRCQEQMYAPELGPDEHRTEVLATSLGIRHSRLKNWVANGLVRCVQRPHSRTWVVWADEVEMKRLIQMSACQRGQTRQKASKA